MPSSDGAAPVDWCPTCSEPCGDHATMCTVCGDSLVARPVAVSAVGAVSGAPPAAPLSSSESDRRSGAAALVEAREALAALRRSGELDGMEGAPDVGGMEARLGALARRLAAAGAGGGGVVNVVSAGGAAAAGVDADGWQIPTAEAADPSLSRNRDRPTSKECMDKLPRIVVDERSSVLHECGVELLPPPTTSGGGGGDGGDNQGGLRRTALSLDATVAEFGPAPPYSVSGRLVLVSPATCKGGLSARTLSALSPPGGGGKTVAYVERGGGVTFARKALLAQDAGASAVVVGQNVGVWPYVMRDSSSEAAAGGGLRVPVVMVKRSDGARLRRAAERAGPGAAVRCSVAAEPTSSSSSSSGHGDCVVCRESFRVGDTVVRLPTCAHCFHESCALMWLRKHNTCPYCRRELPTDDEEYERERRRVARTHAGVQGEEVSGGNQWEDIFG